MFGIFRLALALLVVVFHLSGRHVIGWYSVYAFYTLSGFLMTLVITKKYSLTPVGLADFATNRFLRIYPPFLVMGACAVVLLQFPELSQRAETLTKGDLGMPTGVMGWFENILIWGWHMRSAKLIPQAWTIFRELFFCVLIFFPFARYRWLTLGGFTAGVVYALANVVRGVTLMEVYTTFQNAAICYGAGCCLFHFQKQLSVLTRPQIPLLAVLGLAPFAFEAVRPLIFTDNALLPLYLNTLFSSYLILVLASLRGTPRWTEWDRRLGNLSYPIYLCHYHVAVVVAAVFGWSGKSCDALLWASALPILGFAWLMNRYVEQTIGYGYDQRRRLWSERWPPTRSLPSAGPKATGQAWVPLGD
jgi:peptidoglycan/LPS O-acetylase OafA/YrhL